MTFVIKRITKKSDRRRFAVKPGGLTGSLFDENYDSTWRSARDAYDLTVTAYSYKESFWERKYYCANCRRWCRIFLFTLPKIFSELCSVKHLRWSILRKYFMAFSCQLFSQNVLYIWQGWIRFWFPLIYSCIQPVNGTILAI